MAKERQRRVDKTLGCLVASMTLGALVLYYTQPELPATQGGPRLLIAEPGAEPNLWNAIHLDPEMVNGYRPTSPAHFYIDPSGGGDPTVLWETQRGLRIDAQGDARLRGDGHAIRIGLITPSGSHEITAAQLASAQALVKELSRQFGIAGERVVWDDTLSIPNPQPTSSDLRPEAIQSR